MMNLDLIQAVETNLKECQRVSKTLLDQGIFLTALSKLERDLRKISDHVSRTSIPYDFDDRQLLEQPLQKELERVHCFRWARDLLDLELVRTEESSSSERRIQETLDECLNHVGLRVSFLVSIEILTNVASSSSSSTSNGSSLPLPLLESDGVPAAAIPPKPSQAAVLSSMHTIRRLILSLPNHNQEEENDFETSAAFDTKRISLTNLVEDFYMDATASTHRDSNVRINVPQFNVASNVALELVNIFTRLHTRIAAASYASKFKLPLWSTRIKLGPRLIVCCLYSACVGIASKSDGKMSAEKIQKDDKWSKEDDEIVHVTVFSKLVQQMVHHSTTREVASGIYHFWVDYCDKPSEKNKAVPTLFRSVIHSMFEEIASPRECASLLRSILINTIQLVEMYPTTMNRKEVDRICTKYCMPYLKDCCLCILESSSIVREAFIHLIILSPSPSGEVCEQKLLTRCVALLLASCTYLEEGDDSDYSSDSDTDIDTRDKDDEVDRTQKQGMTALENVVLLKQLCNVSKIWCEPIFTT